uniref:Uncharacterized protein n=1 Tax=Anguilla anguilla TaxID=7936 RepID=A0A0E9QG84_ANGAN
MQFIFMTKWRFSLFILSSIFLHFYFCVLHGLLLFSLCAYLDRTVSLH